MHFEDIYCGQGPLDNDRGSSVKTSAFIKTCGFVKTGPPAGSSRSGRLRRPGDLKNERQHFPPTIRLVVSERNHNEEHYMQ